MRRHTVFPLTDRVVMRLAALVLLGGSAMASADGESAAVSDDALAAACTVQAIGKWLPDLSPRMTVDALPAGHLAGPHLPQGVRFTAAANGKPAYCQVTGSFVTNPDSGKTAGFLATLPANWNGDYLQIGCGGHCGTFAVSDAASPIVTTSVQGLPGDILRKGYAAFATDEGHVGFSSGAWALDEAGKVNRDAVDDLLFRSHKVLSTLGKAFATRFYTAASATTTAIDHAYFAGCSGGGRDGLVAASYFPEAFDGVIVGSPYLDMAGVAFQGVGLSAATLRSRAADLSPELVALVDPIVKARCDHVDGVKDGLIQNPMACDFRPEVDLPRCPQDKAGDDCFTTAQVETLSTVLTAVTDENGRVVQPAYSVSELQAEFRVTPYPQDITVRDPWPDTGNPATGSGGMGTLANATLKVFANDNREDFYSRDLLTFARGGKGDVTGYRVVVPQKAVAHAREQLRMGIGGIPENLGKFIGQGSKMLIWHNLGDQLLTPYMSVNYYKQLAGLHGGYAKLQDSVRLFSLPGTAHCSGGLLIGPGSFDALSAMEAWVEEGVAPNALLATAYPATRFSADFSKPPGRTMPLCMFPQMARYSGKGDVMDAANWHCPADDEGMLQIGESGRQAGVLP